MLQEVVEERPPQEQVLAQLQREQALLELEQPKEELGRAEGLVLAQLQREAELVLQAQVEEQRSQEPVLAQPQREVEVKPP